jgi:hypothetical protein
MKKLDERTSANMDFALEEICRGFPNGGDHETRKHIATQLMIAAKLGNNTLGGLQSVASRALKETRKIAS